jgi:hypothetical protein
VLLGMDLPMAHPRVARSDRGLGQQDHAGQPRSGMLRAAGTTDAPSRSSSRPNGTGVIAARTLILVMTKANTHWASQAGSVINVVKGRGRNIWLQLRSTSL